MPISARVLDLTALFHEPAAATDLATWVIFYERRVLSTSLMETWPLSWRPLTPCSTSRLRFGQRRRQ